MHVSLYQIYSCNFIDEETETYIYLVIYSKAQSIQIVEMEFKPSYEQPWELTL